MRAGQRLGGGREVAEERGLEQVRLDELAEDLEGDLLGAPAGLDRDVVLRGILTEGVQRSLDGDDLADRLADGLVDRKPAPAVRGVVEVDRPLRRLDLA